MKKNVEKMTNKTQRERECVWVSEWVSEWESPKKLYALAGQV